MLNDNIDVFGIALGAASHNTEVNKGIEMDGYEGSNPTPPPNMTHHKGETDVALDPSLKALLVRLLEAMVDVVVISVHPQEKCLINPSSS